MSRNSAFRKRNLPLSLHRRPPVLNLSSPRDRGGFFYPAKSTDCPPSNETGLNHFKALSVQQRIHCPGLPPLSVSLTRSSSAVFRLESQHAVCRAVYTEYCLVYILRRTVQWLTFRTVVHYIFVTMLHVYISRRRVAVTEINKVVLHV